MIFRASSMHRRFACPGSARLEAAQPEEENDQSREGSLLHDYLACPQLDRIVLRPNQRDILKVAEEVRDFVFSRVSDQCEIPSDEPFEEGGGKEWSVKMYGEPVITGHTDLWRRYPRLELVIVCDYKTGFKIVEPAASNIQLRCYAVGAVEEWPKTNRVAVAIVQPRLSYSERCTLALYERSDIDASIGQLSAIVDLCSQPDAPLKVTEACRYCRAKLVCPAYQATLHNGLSLVPATDGTVAKRQNDAVQAIATCTDEQLDRLLIALQMADYVSDLAKDEGRRRVAEGRLTNYKLGKAVEVRKIADAARAIALLSLKGDLNRDEIMSFCAPAIGKLEEKLRDKKHLTWDKAKGLVNDILASVMVREAKKPSLIRETK